MMSKTRRGSELSTYERLSPNCTKPRTGIIKRLTPHMVAGNLTVGATLTLSNFINYDPKNGVSCNYAIGTDGKIGLGVEEKNRSWCSSSPTNDHQTITFEISNDGGAPDWSMSDKALASWVNISVDIATFYGFAKVLYKEKPSTIAVGTTATENWIKTLNVPDDTMLVTLHQWYSDTSCPGPFFKSKLPDLVDEINKRLEPEKSTEPEPTPKPDVKTGSIVTLADNATYYDGKSVPAWVKKACWVVSEVKGDRAVLGINQAGSNNINSPVNVCFLTVVDTLAEVPSSGDIPYLIKITTPALNVRSGPGTNTPVVKTLVNDPNTYTIVEEADGPGGATPIIKWGKLKSGVGWIALMYTKKV